MKCTCNCFLTKPTVPGPDFYFNAKWVPNLQFRWSFHQNLPSHCGKFESTVAYIFQFSQIVLIMSRPTLTGIRREVLALAHESMQASVFAGGMGLTTINHIIWKYGASQVRRGSSEDHSSSRPRFAEDCLTGLRDRALMARMRNLYGTRAAEQTTGSRPVVTVPINWQGSPCRLPTTAVSGWGGHRGNRTWQWPIGSMSSSVTSPDSNLAQ